MILIEQDNSKLRNRNMFCNNRKDIRIKNSYVTYNKVVTKLDLPKTTSAHSLIELSTRQWSRLEGNSFLLTEINTTLGNIVKVGYHNIKIGKNIKLKKKMGKSLGMLCTPTFIDTILTKI